MFINEPFPDCIAYGAMSSPWWSTSVAQTQGGWEQRNQNWLNSRHRYDVSLAIRTATDYKLVKVHFNEMRGQLHSFPFKDYLDYTVTAGEGFLEYVSPGVFNLIKRYGDDNAYDRRITRPVNQTLYRGVTPVTPGAGAGQYSIGAFGVITFVPDQTRTINTHTVGVTHQIVLASAFSPNVGISGKISLIGISGTAAALLNNLEHTVTSVSGATISIAVNTTGLTATGGSARRMVQASELTWSGEFNVPCRYASDQMPAVAVNRNSPDELLVDVSGIEVVEVREV